jgi:outer membrane lipoprotein carrier protein
MLKLKSLLILFLFVIGDVIANSHVVSTEGNAELKALLAPIVSLQATFQQTVRNEQGRLLQNLSGKVVLKRPARFRWEILRKEPRLIIADGKKVWDFDQDLEQVSVQKLSAGQIRAHIFFLTGNVHTLEKDFKITRLFSSKGKCLENSEICFELMPKTEEGSFQWIKIGFKAGVVKEMQLLDQLGQYSHLVFKHIKLNETIPDARFHFVPPAGVDVLEND